MTEKPKGLLAWIVQLQAARVEVVKTDGAAPDVNVVIPPATITLPLLTLPAAAARPETERDTHHEQPRHPVVGSDRRLLRARGAIHPPAVRRAMQIRSH